MVAIPLTSRTRLDVDVPVALATDRPLLAGSRLLLEFALRQARTSTNRAQALATLEKSILTELRPTFGATVKQQIDAESLPASVGWMWIGRKQQLFLLEDVLGSRKATSRVSPETPSTEFGAVFETRFTAWTAKWARTTS